jgi:hypothetical protein
VLEAKRHKYAALDHISPQSYNTPADHLIMKNFFPFIQSAISLIAITAVIGTAINILASNA